MPSNRLSGELPGQGLPNILPAGFDLDEIETFFAGKGKAISALTDAFEKALADINDPTGSDDGTGIAPDDGDSAYAKPAGKGNGKGSTDDSGTVDGGGGKGVA